eukprot:4089702-Amphidinium_carterae.2
MGTPCGDALCDTITASSQEGGSRTAITDADDKISTPLAPSHKRDQHRQERDVCTLPASISIVCAPSLPAQSLHL